jgi:Tim44-like domain
MDYFKQALFGLILVWISLTATAQTGNEVEYVSAPQATDAASAAAPASAQESVVRPKVGKPVRKKAEVAPTVAEPEPAALPPAPAVEEIPAWRTNIIAILEPFGLNGLMSKMGLSGPAADILGLIILLIFGGIILLIVLRVLQVLRLQVADKVASRRYAEPAKDEPLMDAGPSRPHGRSSQNSRMGGNTRNGHPGHPGHPGANSHGGVDSRLGRTNNTRGGPESRIGHATRGGPESRLGPHTRGGHDSRLGAHTQGGGDSRHGLLTLDGHSRMDTRGGHYGGNEAVLNAPEGFDKPRFLRKTRVYFLRLQTAWDKSDFNSVRQFAATPVYTELRKQMLERGDTTNVTDVLAIQTELLGIEVVAGNYIATVKFTGMIKETENPHEQDFDEVWRLSHPRDKPGDWVLSGIIQYS